MRKHQSNAEQKLRNNHTPGIGRSAVEEPDGIDAGVDLIAWLRDKKMFQRMHCEQIMVRFAKRNTSTCACQGRRVRHGGKPTSVSFSAVGWGPSHT